MFRRLLIAFILVSLLVPLVSCGLGPLGQSPTATPTKATKAKATKTPTPTAKTKVKATPTVEEEATTAPEGAGEPTAAPGGEATTPPEGEKEATPTQPEETKPTPTPKEPQTTEGIGQTQQAGDYKVTINSVRRESHGNKSPAEGNEFIIVNATVENTSSHDLPVSGQLMFELRDGSGNTLDQTSSAKTDDELEALVGSGDKFTGETAWEAPKGTTGLMLSFESVLSGDKITFDLGQ